MKTYRRDEQGLSSAVESGTPVSRRTLITRAVATGAISALPTLLRAIPFADAPNIRYDDLFERDKLMDLYNPPNVFETSSFTAAPCRDCDLPGYLVLQPKEIKADIHDLSAQVQRELGEVLGNLENAVRVATGAQHVYILRFSEGLSSVHFHIFPRTQDLAQRWTNSHPKLAKNGINGPLVFAWTRLQLYVDSPAKLSNGTKTMAAKIAATLASATY